MSIQQNIQQRLEQSLNPIHLEVINESHGHNVPKGSESHFKVVIAAEQFGGLSRVKRHQAVYAELQEYLAGDVHALALHTYSPEEWLARQEAPESPACMGGSKG